MMFSCVYYRLSITVNVSLSVIIMNALAVCKHNLRSFEEILVNGFHGENSS